MGEHLSLDGVDSFGSVDKAGFEDCHHGTILDDIAVFAQLIALLFGNKFDGY